MVAQEIEQQLGLAALGAEMDVGEEQRPDAGRLGVFAHVHSGTASDAMSQTGFPYQFDDVGPVQTGAFCAAT